MLILAALAMTTMLAPTTLALRLLVAATSILPATTTTPVPMIRVLRPLVALSRLTAVTITTNVPPIPATPLPDARIQTLAAMTTMLAPLTAATPPLVVSTPSTAMTTFCVPLTLAVDPVLDALTPTFPLAPTAILSTAPTISPICAIRWFATPHCPSMLRSLKHNAS
jgi:hypothetical protein